MFNKSNSKVHTVLATKDFNKIIIKMFSIGLVIGIFIGFVLIAVIL